MEQINNIQRHRQAVRNNIMKSFGADFSDVSKAEENDLEKAHNVGDMHPNGKWVWTEYAPGKFDWRGAKKGKTGQKAAPLKSQAPAQKPQTTSKPADDNVYDVEEYKRQLDMAKQVPDEGLTFGHAISTDNLKRAEKELHELHVKRPNARATAKAKYKEVLYFKGQVKAIEEEMAKRGIDSNGSSKQATPAQSTAKQSAPAKMKN